MRRGLVAASGGTYRLARAIGRQAALDLALTGDEITGLRAGEQAWGAGSPGQVPRPPRPSCSRTHRRQRVARRAGRRIVDVALDHDDTTLRPMAGTIARRLAATQDARAGAARVRREARTSPWQR